VTTSEGKAFAERMGTLFIGASSCTGVHVADSHRVLGKDEYPRRRRFSGTGRASTSMSRPRATPSPVPFFGFQLWIQTRSLLQDL
jgi:hypothetical protein